MKKRTIAFLSAFIMICMMLQPVYADNISFENWSFSYEGTGADNMARDKILASPSDTYYYSSAHALSVKYPSQVSDGYFVVKNTLKSELNPGNYTLEFYIRGTFSQAYSGVGIGTADVKPLNDVQWIKTSDLVGADTKKWTLYKLNFDLTESTDIFYFHFAGYTNGCNIDCVSIKDGDGAEYIQNGDFEELLEPEDPEPEDPTPVVPNPGKDTPDYQSAQILSGYTLSGWESLVHYNSSCGMSAGVTDGDAKSGDYALCITFPNNVNSGHKDYIKNTGKTIQTIATHTYVMGMWIKTNDNTQLADFLSKSKIQIALIDETVEFSDGITLQLNGSDVTIKETTEDGWTNIERTWTTGANRTAHNIAIMFDYKFKDSGYTDVKFLLDDVYFYDSTANDGENHFDNPSFENVYLDPVDPTPAGKGYAPVNFITTPISGGLAVSWKNPSIENIKNISLYNITDGEVFVNDNFSISPSQNNRYKITGLENGKVYHYKLRITYSDGNKYEYFVYGIPQANDTQLSPWGVTLSRDNEEGFTAGEFTIDSSEKAEGEASLKYVSNSPGGNSRFALLSRSASVEVGADYRLSFKAKAKNNSLELQVKNGWNNLDGVSNPVVSGFSGTYGWKDFTVNIKGASSTSIKFYFILEGISEGVWLDSFSLYKIEDGNETGENLITSPGFEELYKPSELGKISGISANGGDEKINVSWSGSSGATKLKLFQEIEGNYDPIGYIYPSLSNLTISSLQNDTEYSFALACADSYGNIGEKAFVTGSTVAPDFKVDSPALYEGKKEVSGFSSGEYVVKTNVKNNRKEEAVPVTQIVVLYKGDVLKKTVSTTINAEKIMPDKPSTVISTQINIPENTDGDYHLNVFLWDSKKGMRSLYDFMTFEQKDLED